MPFVELPASLIIESSLLKINASGPLALAALIVLALICVGTYLFVLRRR